MAIADKITQLQTDISNAYDEIETMGGTIPEHKNTENLATAIGSIPSGGADFEIDNGYNLFSFNARLNIMNELLALCKDLTTVQAMFSNSNNLTSLDLTDIDFSSCTNCNQMFYYCRNLTSVDLSGADFSHVTTFQSMFENCYALINVDFSNTQFASGNCYGMFMSCTNLETIDISSIAGASNSGAMFAGCTKLKTLIINNSNMFPMTNTNMLQNTPIASGTGYVYVPDNLVNTYKADSKWSTYANQIKGMSDLPS